MFSRWRAYFQGFRRRDAIDAEAAEELQFHLECETQANLARGLPYEEARRRALGDLGGVTQIRERIREVRHLGLGDLARDLQYGARALLRTPRFSVVALLTVTLIVGGITATFSLVYGVLLRPLPYPDADRLVAIESVQPHLFGPMVARADAEHFQAHSESFDLWALYRPGYVADVPHSSGEPVQVQNMLVTPDTLALFGIGVAHGRPLLPSDTSAAAPDVVVISFDLWQRYFGGRPSAVGSTIVLGKDSFTVVGVTRPDADVPLDWLSMPIVWRPLREGREEEARFTAVARLRPEAPLARARSELAVLADGLAAAHPATHRGRTATATLLLDRMVGDYQRLLWLFFAAVSCVLLIGVGNLTGLQLARNAAREREITVRAALGATRWRLTRQLLVESLLLSAAGGAAGVAVAWGVLQMVTSALPARFPRADQIGVDLPVALFAAAVSLVAGVAVGAWPAWVASRQQLTARLKEGGLTATSGGARSRTQRGLIVCQTAIALVLAIGAGLLANSFYRLMTRTAGMHEDGLWVINATLPRRYRDIAAQNALWASALEHLRRTPGVVDAALSANSSGPLSGGDISTTVAPEGVTLASPRDGLRVSYRRVSERYFETVGTPMLRGRPVLASDVDGAERVAVLNELAAASLWPGQDAVGKRVQFFGQPVTIVGVIPTFRHARLDGDFTPQLFVPHAQRLSTFSSSAIMLRTLSGDQRAVAAATAALAALEPDMRIEVSTMTDVRWRLLANERFRAAVLIAFAGTAVFLTLVGIFGLVAYTVGQRYREIAVHVALGAVRRDIVRLASRHAIVPALAGLAIGLAGSVATTRLLASYLADVHAVDPLTFAAAFGVLALGALAAAILPARRALAIDPIVALRAD